MATKLSKPTQKQLETYLKGNTLACPKCGSESLEWGSLDLEGGSVYQPVTCNRCNSRWHDGYTLDRVMWGDGTDFVYKPEAIAEPQDIHVTIIGPTTVIRKMRAGVA